MDGHIGAERQPVLNVKIPLAGLVGLGAAGLVLGTMATHGFDDAGLRLASEWSWRFASFVFFAAVIAGPVCRLVPPCALTQSHRRQIIWSFCAAYGVFLASLILPNSLGGVMHEDATMGMTAFALFGGLAMAVMGYCASGAASLLLGEKPRHALLHVAASFFWLTYALTGLAHLSGPHRPDGFYGLSLSLMIFALLLRFTDRFIAKLRGTPAVSAP